MTERPNCRWKHRRVQEERLLFQVCFMRGPLKPLFSVIVTEDWVDIAVAISLDTTLPVDDSTPGDSTVDTECD